MNYYDMLLARKLAKGELPPNAYLLKEASGSLVSFSDGADLPTPSFICNIDAVQDLHGYDSPWAGGAGKNLIPLTVDNLKNINTDWSGDSTTKGGVTFTILKDAVGNVTGIKANGTATQTAQFYLAKNFYIEGTTYTLSGFDSSLPQNSESYIRVYASGNTITINHDTSSSYKDLATLDNYIIWISIAGGTVVNNAIFYPQLEKGSSATSFAPYSNICPISGHTGVEANVSPTTEASAGTTYSVSWQTEAGEVFGGYVDLVSGVLTVDRAIKTVADCYWYGSNGFFYTETVMNEIVHGDGRYDHCISDVYATKNVAQSASLVNGEMSVDASGYLQLKDARYSSASDFKTAMGTSQFVYELATPITYQLTPTQIKSLLGNNNAWCSTGDVTLEYFGKGAE